MFPLLRQNQLICQEIDCHFNSTIQFQGSYMVPDGQNADSGVFSVQKLGRGFFEAKVLRHTVIRDETRRDLWVTVIPDV